MTRPVSASGIGLLCGFLTLALTQSEALSSDLVLDGNSVTFFSALDGGPQDEDGVTDGILTLSSLTITDRAVLVVDELEVEFHVLGDIRLEGTSAIRPSDDPLPATGPSITILSGQSLVMVGTSDIIAGGVNATFLRRYTHPQFHKRAKRPKSDSGWDAQ